MILATELFQDPTMFLFLCHPLFFVSHAMDSGSFCFHLDEIVDLPEAVLDALQTTVMSDYDSEVALIGKLP